MRVDRRGEMFHVGFATVFVFWFGFLFLYVYVIKVGEGASAGGGEGKRKAIFFCCKFRKCQKTHVRTEPNAQMMMCCKRVQLMSK